MNPAEKNLPILKWLTLTTRLSRRKAFDAIVSGRVKIDGVVVTDVKRPVAPEKDRVFLDGKPLRQGSPAPIYILLHKPRGVVTTTKDTEGRATVLDLIRKIKTPVFPVGRLDIMTEGLLLLTNDGPLANTLLHPRYGVPRTYHVKVKGRIPPKAFAVLKKGEIRLDGRPVRPVSAEVLKSLEKNTWLKVTLREGKNREVRRIFAKLGLPVLGLVRVGFGPLSLNGLAPGQWRLLTEKEVSRLRNIANRNAKAADL